jgi:hypothetical protein
LPYKISNPDFTINKQYFHLRCLSRGKGLNRSSNDSVRISGKKKLWRGNQINAMIAGKLENSSSLSISGEIKH